MESPDAMMLAKIVRPLRILKTNKKSRLKKRNPGGMRLVMLF